MPEKSDTESLESRVVDVQNSLNKSFKSKQQLDKNTNTSTNIVIEPEMPSNDVFQKLSRFELYAWLEGKNLGWFNEIFQVIILIRTHYCRPLFN